MKHLKLFEDQKTISSKYVEFYQNLRILKEFVKKLEKSYQLNKIMLAYAIILHNYIILEKAFSLEEEAKINKNLDLTHVGSTYWVNAKLIELYDPEHIIRNKVEAFDMLKLVGEILINNPEIYTRLYTEDEIDMLIQSNKFNL